MYLIFILIKQCILTMYDFFKARFLQSLKSTGSAVVKWALSLRVLPEFKFLSALTYLRLK